MVVVYATYLVASALSSQPSDDKTCNPLDMRGTTQTTSMLVGSVLTFLALAYSTSAAATKDLSGESIALADTEAGIDTGAGEFEDGSEEEEYSYVFFHFVFVIASMYLVTPINT
jgi:hypothetical protein